MNLKIKKVILWSKNEALEPKEIEFKEDKINVIVGDSQTGKSSIIPIIDYCLCSSKCTIPVGPIRKATKWFGVLLANNENELLLVRAEPGSNQSTNQMYYEEGKKIQIPKTIPSSNRTSEQITNRLNTLCGLPSLDFSESDNIKPYEGRPSIKDMLAFCFQSQHIIANPYTLFYQADTIEHKLKLRTVFPLALGLIQSNTLELQKRLSSLTEQLKEKNGILEYKRKIRDAWSAEVKGNYLRAMEFGILNDTPFPDDNWKLEDYVVYLQRVPEIAQKMSFPVLSEGVTSRVIAYTTKVQRKEAQILNSLEEKAYKLSLLKSFKNTSSDYELAIKNQRARLEPVNNGWLSSKLNSLNNCPVCGSHSDNAKASSETLVRTAFSIEEKVSQIKNSKDILDKEISEIEKDIDELEKQLNNIRTQLYSLGREHDNIERQRKSIEDLYRYVGRIEQNLKNLHETNIDSSLHEDILNLNSRIAEIQKELNESRNKKSRDAIMKRISQTINFYKRTLKVEDADNPTELDEKQLTLKITSKDNRTDYLWEIGSGSNWMGYHISTLLALHEHFISLKSKNHVPTFMIFDQPSQAYFPDVKRLIVENDDDKKNEELSSNEDNSTPLNKSDENNEELDSTDDRNQIISDDAERVKAIFEAFSDFYERTKFRCQIIVLEHASPDYWGDVSHTHFVGSKRWVKGDALIPASWLDED